MVRWWCCFFFLFDVGRKAFTFSSFRSRSFIFSLFHTFLRSSFLFLHLFALHYKVLVHSFDTVSSSFQSFCFCFICAHMTDLRICCIILIFVRSFDCQLTLSPFLSFYSLSFALSIVHEYICFRRFVHHRINLLQHRLVVFNCCVDALQMNVDAWVLLMVVMLL